MTGKDAEDAARWGRVGDDGTVFVRTSDGERPVGQYPEGTPEEALAFFTRRYDALAFEVELLEQRVRQQKIAPDEAGRSVAKVRQEVAEAHAVGDLDALLTRLGSLEGVVAEQRERRKAAKVRQQAEGKARKERIVAEAEQIAESTDWRNGANRMRSLLEEWKSLPRLDKPTDDALWRRFSGARTTYTRHRKAHFAEVNERRDEALGVKERLIAEAEAIAESTDWGPTSARYRDLMQRWKAAGPAPKGVDDRLWQRFRAAQDTFFGARDRANAERDREFAANAEQKEVLLAEAEALLPVTDVEAAKRAFRDIADRWDAAGKVPRERIKELEGRMRSVERSIRDVEDQRRQRSNPEGRARAADTVSQLEDSLARLQHQHERALEAGNEPRAREHAADIEARESWLDEAKKALDEFSG